MADPTPKAVLQESILISIMERLDADSTDFGTTSYAGTIMQSINTHISALTQIGIGPREGFRIENELSVWSDLLGDAINLECAKDYIFLKTKLEFDPPTAASIESFEKMAAEALTRCSYVAEGFILT